MNQNDIRGDIPALVAMAALLVILLIVDAATPVGYAEWVLYFLPIGATLFQSRQTAPFIAAALAVTFSALGLMLSPDAGSMVQAVINRATGALAQLAMAFLVWQVLRERRHTQDLLWVQQGQAALTQAMLGEMRVEAVGARAVQVLAQLLQADAAVLYRVDGSQLLRLAGHAIDESSAPERIALGEGVAGEVGRTGQLRELAAPPGHLKVASALGRSAPQRLLVAPLLMGEQPLGVVELAFLDRSAMHPQAAALLRLCGEDVATALRGALFREREVQLLEETQRQSEELQAQQEELRVANEELEEQSRVLQESNARLENQQAELEQTNVQLEEQAQALQRQKERMLEVQQELQLNADRLAATNRYKSEFLANMSHELRTPLNSSMILAKLLSDNREENLSAEQVKYARTILAANNDLLSLINDILDLSKIEAGRVEFALEPVTVQELLAQLQAVVEPMARQKNLSFRLEAAEGAPTVLHTDGKRLQQVLKNLLANAVKFTDSGSVALVVRRAPGQRVRFEVRDTGIGIAADQQELIFEAFRQADGSTSRRYGGTGLGLSISRELAQRLGGGIEVDSEPGLGSCFTLDLPVDGSAAIRQANEVATASPQALPPAAPATAMTKPAPASAASATPPPAAAAAGGLQRRHPDRLILAVEDDPAFAKVLVELAGEQGFDAAVAGSAQDALQMARELKPDAVLLDVVLPDSSGLTVLEQLKRDPATRHIPVHVVSGYERTRPALEMGAVGYVMKPARREDLEAAIHRLEHRLQSTVRHLLIVEDDDTLRDNLQLLLQGDQTRITAVGTVEEALRQLQQQSFDCMVTDLALPDASGYDLLERMAANEALSFPPVIVYTGRALTRDEEERLRRYSKSIIVKGARSPERLLDEVTLFLHSVEARLPADQQRLLRQARRRDSVLDGRRILLAEDDVRNVFALTGVFEPLGVQLVVARNGREALQKLEEGGADLVLMDVMMPEMDGLAAMRAIRAQPRWRQLPIIALTAKAMSDDRERCLEAGANDYIAKPIDVDKLVSLCRVWAPK